MRSERTEGTCGGDGGGSGGAGRRAAAAAASLVAVSPYPWSVLVPFLRGRKRKGGHEGVQGARDERLVWESVE
jgi:hypothetical protein